MPRIKELFKKGKILFLGVLIAFGVTSCYTDYGLSTADYDVVYTKYNKAVNFTQFKTFAMPDSVYHLVGEGEEDNISRQFDALILSTVVRNLEQRGFVRVDSVNAADAVVVVTVSEDTYSGAIYYPPYWGYPGWGWDWYYYYPPYWGDVTYYEYNTGTIHLQFADIENVDGETILYTDWMAIMNGLLSSNVVQTQSRIENAVNQAFSQSPYLKTN